MNNGHLKLWAFSALLFLNTACQDLQNQLGNVGGDGLNTEDPGLNLPPPTVAPIDLSPDFLVGLSPLQVEAILGKATSNRTVANTQIWGYGDSQCGFDIYFPHTSSGKVTVLAVESRLQQASSLAVQTCFAQLRRRL